MKEHKKSIGKYVAVGCTIIGILIFAAPETMEAYLFPLLSFFSIGAGVFLLASLLRAKGKTSHPIFSGVIALCMIGLGIYASFIDVNLYFGGIILGGASIILGLGRLAAYYKRKGTPAALPPAIWCFIYWLFAVFLTKVAGESDMAKLLAFSGAFFIAIGVQLGLSVYRFSDL